MIYYLLHKATRGVVFTGSSTLSMIRTNRWIYPYNVPQIWIWIRVGGRVVGVGGYPRPRVVGRIITVSNRCASYSRYQTNNDFLHSTLNWVNCTIACRHYCGVTSEEHARPMLERSIKPLPVFKPQFHIGNGPTEPCYHLPGSSSHIW